MRYEEMSVTSNKHVTEGILYFAVFATKQTNKCVMQQKKFKTKD